MSMRLLTAEQVGNVYEWRVLLDETKTLRNGDPDPAWIRTERWPVTIPELSNMTEQEHIDMQAREMALLCANDPRIAPPPIRRTIAVSLPELDKKDR